MKIAYIYDAVYPWVKGGAEKRVYELARRMVREGHEVHWYSWGWWWPEEGEKDIVFEGIHLHGVGKPHELYNNNRRSIKEAIYFAIKLIPYIFKEEFDVVDCQGFPFFSSFTAKLHSIMGKSRLTITLLEVWNDYWYTYLGTLGFFGKLLERMTLQLTNKIICISEKTLKDLQQIRKVPGVVIVPPGIDFQEIENFKPKNDSWDVIFAGRLIKEKRVDLLINALPLVKESYPNINCVVIGDGPEMENLKKLSIDLGLRENLAFLGFLENSGDLLGHMKSSKVFVLPSEREGFGIVVLEANACGLPVVVVESSMNAAVDLVQEGTNGFISLPNYGDMALKITQALKEKDNINERCIDFARGYDWDQIVSGLEDYYIELLEQK